MSTDLRFLAFYLPQFHPIPENDEWWGAGFTEWRNVVRATPRFRGHYQPHLPGELGFYDLRVPEVREAQARLAREHGIDGFVYYHYWFTGKRLLERPFHEVLESGRPDFPFALCWANENWTRIWDGGADHVLAEQVYSEDDNVAHLQYLAEAFADPRYVRVDGRPLFLVYRASRMPDPRRTTDTWRREARRLGIGELYLCRVEAFAEDRGDPPPWGFDAAVEFQPDTFRPALPMRRRGWQRALRRVLWPRSVYRVNDLYDYRETVRLALDHPPVPYRRYRCVMPSWDNSARKQMARIVVNTTPERYEEWVRGTVERFTPYSPEENFVFVDAWNEWAEGNHMEPDLRWGRGYLEAHRRGAGRPVPRPR